MKLRSLSISNRLKRNMRYRSESSVSSSTLNLLKKRRNKSEEGHESLESMRKRLQNSLKQRRRESSRSYSFQENRKNENLSLSNLRWTRCIKIKLKVSVEVSKLSMSRKEDSLRKRKDEGFKTSNPQLRSLTLLAMIKRSFARRLTILTERLVTCKIRSKRLKRNLKLRTRKRDS